MLIIAQGTSVTTRLVSSSSTRQPGSLLFTSPAHSQMRSLFLIVIYTFVVNAPLAVACTMGSTKGRHLLPSRSPSRIPDISVSWPSLPPTVHLAALVAGQYVARTDHGHRPIHIHGACSILSTLTLFCSPNFCFRSSYIPVSSHPLQARTIYHDGESERAKLASTTHYPAYHCTTSG